MKCEANQIERRGDVIPRIRIPTGPYIFVEEAMTDYPMIKLYSRVALNHFPCSTR